MAKKLHAVVYIKIFIFLFIMLPVTAISQLRAGFFATPLSGCPPMVINFKDTSAGNPTSWRWDFGNGDHSNIKNPVATYLNSGTYTVKLVIKNERGVDSFVNRQYIVVNALPVVNFAASATTGCFPLKVDFTDRSLAGSGTITAWEWDFGDGGVSTVQNPTHTYTFGGNFRVILKITNSNGCVQFVSKSAFIKLKNGVKSVFEYSSASGCQTTPAPITFINKSSGTGELTYKWDFGDGQTSSEPNPVNLYKYAGVYTVKLITTNSNGCSDTLIKTNAINIGFVKADFTKAALSCAGTAFQFTNSSAPASFTGSSWDFGDGTSSAAATPLKSYELPGDYTVKLVTNFGTCKDSVTKTITVLPKPEADFNSVTTNSCSAPLNVVFANTTNNSISYHWNFGDISSSTLQNPEHIYLSTGNFNVSLIATNADGCTDTTIKENFVKIIPPKIAGISNLPAKGCIPLIITPVAVMQDTALEIKSYLWDFGDGTTSTKAAPKHTYTTQGNFTVKLTITSSGCTDSLIVVNAVKAGMKPEAHFTADSRKACASQTINFTDRTTGATVTEWQWNFGDGNFSAVQNSMHKYRDTGYFTVSLAATNFGCTDTLKIKKYIYINPPIARFDTTFLCSTPLKRNFIDKSIKAKSWAWDFGDGQQSDKQKVSHTYATAGSYPVSLSVTNGACKDTFITTVAIIDEQGKLTVNNPVSCINTSVAFTVNNINSSNIRAFSWYFNGIAQPAAAIVSNPAATRYAAPGTYNPAAIVTNILNCPDTLYTSEPITIYGSKANFSTTVAGACPGDVVSFNDSTKTDGIHPVSVWSWNFGDGSGSQAFTGSPFTHQYNKNGAFGVSLTVTDSYNCKDSIFKPNTVIIAKPAAKFMQSDTLICPQTTVTFTNQTAGANNTYIWDFGDSTISADVSPLHAYLKEGKYTIKLKVINAYKCSDSTTSYINVVKTTSGFLMSDSFINCPPLTVNFTNTSVGFSGFEWDFDDDAKSALINPSHIYTEPDIYKVKLLVKNNSGCSDSATKTIVVKGPKGVFSYVPLTVCTPGTINFKANVQTAVKYYWNYQEGNSDSTIQSTSSHIFETPGFFVPKLIVEDSTGCRFVITGKDTIIVNNIKTKIVADKTILCDSGTVQFSNNTVSSNGISTYKWSFDDGSVSSLSNPQHTFVRPGTYNIKLQVTAPGGCSDSATIIVTVSKLLVPVILTDSAACAKDSVSFSAKLLNDTSATAKWNWDFDNGKNSSLQNPDIQYYDKSGNYTVTLAVTNSAGCVTKVTKSLVIHPKPVLEVTRSTTICTGNTISLTASGAAVYTWVSTDSSLSCTVCPNPVAHPAKDTKYTVKGTTAEGCSALDSVTVKVQQPFSVTVFKDTSICRGQSVQLTATGAPNYLWIPSAGLSSASVSNPLASPKITTIYRVIGYDALPCRTDTATVTVTVYDNPVVDLGPDKTITARSSVTLSPSVSADVIKLSWLPATGLSCTDCAKPEFIARNNISYQLHAENEHCVAEDEIKIFVTYDNKVVVPNAFSPNGDGINDVFYPTGNNASFVKSFIIYNRWGKQIFAVNQVPGNDPAYGWNGTSNGAASPIGVYYYILELIGENNKTTQYTGHVTLLK